jgi:hypothetical protein
MGISRLEVLSVHLYQVYKDVGVALLKSKQDGRDDLCVLEDGQLGPESWVVGEGAYSLDIGEEEGEPLELIELSHHKSAHVETHASL